jgi:hypothetical protein
VVVVEDVVVAAGVVVVVAAGPSVGDDVELMEPRLVDGGDTGVDVVAAGVAAAESASPEEQAAATNAKAHIHTTTERIAPPSG